MNPRYIVVEGAIGSGKTALSRRLAEHFSALLLSENPDHNPFLMKFYSNVSNNGLAAELFFLMRRAESVNIIEDQCAQGGMVVADFLLEKDRIFTPIVLNDDEQQLFADMKQRILPQYAEPDVVIYLQTAVENNRKRLQKRHEGIISLFPEGYLGRVHDEYSHFFHLYQSAPLLTVNADELDLAGNDDYFQLLLRTLEDFQGTRSYLNLSEK